MSDGPGSADCSTWTGSMTIFARWRPKRRVRYWTLHNLSSQDPIIFTTTSIIRSRAPRASPRSSPNDWPRRFALDDRRAFLGPIASWQPAGRLTNQDLAVEYPDWTPEKILDKTGIAERPIAAADQCASDLAVAAARALFESGGCRP